MYDDRPAEGLFPEKHNIRPYANARGSKCFEVLGGDTHGPRTTFISNESNGSHADGPSNLSSGSSINSSATDSIVTSVLLDVLNEEGITSPEAYHEAAHNRRFFLLDKYEQKKKQNMPELFNANVSSYDDLELDDFQLYNVKTRKNNILQDKLQKLMAVQNSGTVKVLGNNEIKNKFLPAEPQHENRKRLRRWKGDFSNFVQKNVRVHLGDKAMQGEDLSQRMLSRSSTNTLIIDNAVYNNVAIDAHIEQSKNYEGYYSNDQTMSEPSNKSTSESNDLSNRELKGWKRWKPSWSPHVNYGLQRKLKVRHIQMLPIGTCLSVGIFFTSGKAFNIAGPFGALLGFTLGGSIVLATLLSFTELCSLIPVSSGFSGLASRFVEDGFGFAMGWTYWFSGIIGLPAQAASATYYLSYYQDFEMSSGVTIGFVTLFSLIAIVVNLFDVRSMGEVVYVIGLIKVLISIVLIFALVVMNAGHGNHINQRVGFRYWDSSKSVPQKNLTYGLFRPTFDLKDSGEGSKRGTGGDKGRFLSLFAAMLTSAFAFSGIEMNFLATGEAVNPRKTIPLATKRTFTIVLILYIFLMFSVGINIYSGDPRLLSFYHGISLRRYRKANVGVGSEWQLSYKCPSGVYGRPKKAGDGYSSPWVLALLSFGYCQFAAAINAILIMFTSTACIPAIYATSRTLYAMAVQNKAPHVFQICDSRGVPYPAVIFTGLFFLIGFSAINGRAEESFDTLVNLASACVSIIWMGLNLSFLRFFYAIKTRTDTFSREDQSYPYKSPFQPYLAYYGLIGSSIYIIFGGFINFIHTLWDTRSFFSSYGGVMIFVTLYSLYKVFGTSKIQRLDQLDLDTGRREMDRIIWIEHRQYNGSYAHSLKKFVTWLF